MEIIIHRVNTIEALKALPKEYGAEIDIRAHISTNNNKKFLLHHEPGVEGDDLEEWLTHYEHGTLILNIKEDGIEHDVLELVKAAKVKNYFFLDVEFPFIYRSLYDAKTGKARSNPLSAIAIRYSEAEPIEFALAHKGLAEWLWIDTNTRLPLDEQIVNALSGFKTCLVCPSRWGRPEDIPTYKKEMESLSYEPSAVMTTFELAEVWKNG